MEDLENTLVIFPIGLFQIHNQKFSKNPFGIDVCLSCPNTE